MVHPEIQTLRIVIGGDRSNLYELRDGESLTLGRDPICTIQVTHPSVSPIHLRLNYNDGVLVAIDLDSREGIVYQNKKRKRLELKKDASFYAGALDIATSRGPPITASPSKELFRTSATAGTSGTFFKRRFAVRRKAPLSFGRLINRLIKKNAPFLTVSFCFHLLVWFLIADIPFISEKLYLMKHLIAQIMTQEDVILLDEEDQQDEISFDEPYLPDEEILDPLEEQLIAEEIFPEIPDQNNEIAIRGLGPGSVINSGLAGEGVARLSGYTYSKDFQKFVNELRTEGMDVAFVVDSTSSMDPFIDEAKRIVSRLISKLAAIVPNLRLAIVTYRDQGDDYVTRSLDLTTDRYEILNFLEDCEAEGGGDYPEAVYEALKRTASSLFWRPEARKVIILVGDAPFHADDCAKLDQLLRIFCTEENKGVVNAVYVGSTTDTSGGDPQEAIDCMKHITEIAYGEFTRVADYEDIIKHLVHLTFGTQWQKDVNRLLSTVKQSRMSRVVERKVREGQKAWLLDGLKKIPVSAGIVKALIESTDAADFETLISYLKTPRIPAETKWACVYILRKRLGVSIKFDPISSKEQQNRDIERIQKTVSRFTGLPEVSK